MDVANAVTSNKVIYQVRLADGRPLCVCEFPSAVDSRTWIVFLPGSGAEFWDFDSAEKRSLLSSFAARREPHLLMINKVGVDAQGALAPVLYERSFRRAQRILDYQEVLYKIVPRGHRIFLVGFSEGAYLAPEIALTDRRIEAISLLSGGTRSWLDEELYKCQDPRSLREVIQRVGAVYARPNSTRALWHRVSHATWTSYDTDRTREALLQLRLPIFAAFGSEDRMIDVVSALQDLRAVKKARVITRIYPGVDHTLERYWLPALRASSKFFNGVPRQN